MNPLTLSVNISILDIKKKTKAKFWKNIEVGDIVTCKYAIKTVKNYQLHYAPSIKLFCSGLEHETSPQILSKILGENFEFEEIS